MTLTMVKMTREEEAADLVRKLTSSHENGTVGVNILYISSTYNHLNIYNPWDLFRFCSDHDIWLQIDEFEDGYCYHGIKLKRVTMTILDIA